MKDQLGGDCYLYSPVKKDSKQHHVFHLCMHYVHTPFEVKTTLTNTNTFPTLHTLKIDLLKSIPIWH